LSRTTVGDDFDVVSERLLPPATPRLTAIRDNGNAIRELHDRMGEIQPGDWLERHPETGQTLDQFLVDHRDPVDEHVTTMYVQPLGEMTQTQQRLLDDTADFLARFFGFPVKLEAALPLDGLPPSARRPGSSASPADEQFLTTYILNEILKPRVPADAVAMLGLTARDVWGGGDWNYLFGQASLTDRVGIWSIHRFGDPARGDEGYAICLRRTLGTAVHESGHMFGFLHCVAYECGMNGSNNLAEKDRRPIEFCPECQQKIWWCCNVDPGERYARLAEFADSHGLEREGQYWRSAMKRVQSDTLDSIPK
jgi:archaemetzincin